MAAIACLPAFSNVVCQLAVVYLFHAVPGRAPSLASNFFLINPELVRLFVGPLITFPGSLCIFFRRILLAPLYVLGRQVLLHCGDSHVSRQLSQEFILLCLSCPLILVIWIPVVLLARLLVLILLVRVPVIPLIATVVVGVV